MNKSIKICLACSAGGHLRELQLAIGDLPNKWHCYWLTLKTTSTKAILKDKEHVYWPQLYHLQLRKNNIRQ